ncbi:protein TIC 20-I, chloroplastic-like [Quillaja saponaria]|uniref:Protein TIC 20 n=1 Tax=Quillaja saponaria TaxID=32244 RepID=A0AAD7PB09_QUISA|nr:protein TIC 20-I, chloroplastic-like [Quillaja saponaria]
MRMPPAVAATPVSRLLAKSLSPFLAPPHSAAFRYKDVILERYSSVRREQNRGTVVTFNSMGNSFRQLSAASTPQFLKDIHAPLNRVPLITCQNKSKMRTQAIKHIPSTTEKPEWWWRSLSCIPYLMALQLSDTGFYLQPFLDKFEYFEMVYYIPGSVNRLPSWFTMIYYLAALTGVVKNKNWPLFFRFHVMMGLLLETGLQVIWYSSNFMPLIHYSGTFGMYYWAGMGLTYILIMLGCIRCALAGVYVKIPFVSESASIQCLTDIGGFQRPF